MRRLLVPAAVALATLLSCAEDPDLVADPDVLGSPDAEGSSAFFDDPAAFEGETLTLELKVHDVVDDTLFEIAADDPNGDRYLVIHDGNVALAQDDRVEVTARVDTVNVQELEEEVGADLEVPTFERYEGDYALFAENVDLVSP